MLVIGDKVVWGSENYIVSAVGFVGGERYYWLSLEGSDCVVCMLPAATLEQWNG